MTNSDPGIAGVILAGGRATRMGGGDKPLKPLAGRPMLAYVIERLGPQVNSMVLNANGDPSRFAEFGLPVVPDSLEGFAGPLAGVLAGLRWAEEAVPESRFVVSVAGDTPFFPRDLAPRLLEAGGGRDDRIVLAASPDGLHPVFGLWPLKLADALETFLTEGEARKILAFTDRHHRTEALFETLSIDGEEVDPFFNVNTPEEVERAEAIAKAMQNGNLRGPGARPERP
ncbi:MAG TPA: molybdenum cofactor guanylyltransferase MobA [Afifellaceae bacterium]|nr:molybdenum cofactor guanylyltransferase MobA [Afifellaceae bacterium]